MTLYFIESESGVSHPCGDEYRRMTMEFVASGDSDVGIGEKVEDSHISEEWRDEKRRIVIVGTVK